MMDLPSPADVTAEAGRAREDWLQGCGESQLLVLGGGVAAVTAGLVVQESGRSVVLVETARTPRDRFFASDDPLMILSPTDEVLEELGLDVDGTPPVWRNPVSLETALLHRFLEAGGSLVRRAVVDGRPASRGRTFEVKINLGADRRVFAADDLMLTTPCLDPEPAGEPSEHVLHEMVLATRRREDGMIQAGYQALGDRRISPGVPAVNGLVLSGRKAAELVLAS